MNQPEPAAPEHDPKAAQVTITWSEIRYYTATVPLGDLEDAVLSDGPTQTGHPMPADLRALEGAPFDHGDLNGLLCELEIDHLRNVGNIEVTSIIMEGSG